jgi:rhomboid protease GluP
MDWSLVLVSQGIESTIDHSDETGWGLIVSPEEENRALNVIQQYRVENIGWSWRQRIRRDIMFDWGSLAWLFLLCLFFALQKNESITQAGIMSSVGVSKGQWWRLFTGIFLHHDAAHLAANASLGLVLLGLVMGGYGTGVGLLAGLLTGAAGNFLTWILFANHRSLGASGTVMGCLGLLAVQAVPLARKHPSGWKYLIGGIFAGILLFIFLGMNPGSDVLAHFGGFIAGLLLGSVLMLQHRFTQNTAANIVAGSLFALVVILTWGLALR